MSPHAIDSFLLARLKAKGLGFAGPADRRTLIRRVTYDLIGLPPTPAEIESFVNDRRSDAYNRLVERLLADPRYGERWGRHWLDVARFGESNGFERDQFRPNAWRYRDYVVDAFNSDKNYYQFVREQIAGDVLEPRTRDGIAATGFLVVGPYDEVGHTLGSEVMKARVREEEMEEMVGTVAQTFLGLTANCARCHDHKFDPIPQRDYYRLKAALEGVSRGDRPLVTPAEERERTVRASAIGRSLKDVEVSLAAIDHAARTRARLETATLRPYARWTFETGPRDIEGRLGGKLEGSAKVANGRLVLDGVTAFLRSDPIDQRLKAKTLEAWVILPDRKQRGGGVVSVQAPDASHFDAITFGEREPGKWAAGSEFFRRTKDLDAPAEPSDAPKPIHIAVAYSADGRITVYRNGAPYSAAYAPSPQPVTYEPGRVEVLIGLRHAGAPNGYLKGEVEEVRLYDRALSVEEIRASFESGVDRASPAILAGAMTSEERAVRIRLAEQAVMLRKQLEDLDTPPVAYALLAADPKPTRVLARGDVDNPGEVVGPGRPSCLARFGGSADLPPTSSDAERRLAMARWLGDSRNPLVARVIVNRIWHYHFGRGIVASPNDFGFNGEAPSHPELLDWLAARFAGELHGSIKALHRLILRSQAYLQSAAYNAKAAALDADDRLLWRWPPKRLEGEAVRDSMLFISGQLNPARGGPSFTPWKVVVDNSHFYTQFDSAEPAYNRRTLYRASVNSAKNPVLETLDCPDPSTKTPRRALTTTPMQALELMNNSFVLRQAHELARRLEKGSAALPGRIRLAYELCFGRDPTARDQERSVAFASRHGLDAFCRVLFNTTEFLYVR